MPMDVMADGQLEAVFDRIAQDWGRLDFLVHSIAFSTKDALGGRVVDVPRQGFQVTMDVSVWSFLRMAHLAEPLMKDGGTLFTMTYYGSREGGGELQHHGRRQGRARIQPSATSPPSSGRRASASTRSPPARSPPAPPPASPSSTSCSRRPRSKSPARALVDIDDVGAACAFLAHDAARLMTGQVLYIDGGYNIID